jgi:glyoxylase-like metal-dependent hydrolase (beta-lactamase superfamily II)
MQIKTLSVGQLQANCYLLWNEETLNCFIIDPGDDADFITEEVLRLGLNPQAILLTHGHFDHCLGCLELKLNFNLPIYLHPKDNFLYQNAAKSADHWSATKALKQPPTLPFPKEIKLDEKIVKIISTPGHTPGSVCFYAKPYLFTGDTLFADTVGATNHAYSSRADLQKSLKTLAKLPPETEIYPGHGESSNLATALSPDSRY